MNDSKYSTQGNIQQVLYYSEYLDVLKFRKKHYSTLYPSLTNIDQPDPQDLFSSDIWFSKNQYGKINSTARLTFDSGNLPSEKYAKDYLNENRRMGKNLAELSRMIIYPCNVSLHIAYFLRAFKLARKKDIDIIYIVAPFKKRKFFADILGARPICLNIFENFGSEIQFSAYFWNIHNKHSRFIRSYY